MHSHTFQLHNVDYSRLSKTWSGALAAIVLSTRLIFDGDQGYQALCKFMAVILSYIYVYIFFLSFIDYIGKYLKVTDWFEGSG